MPNISISEPVVTVDILQWRGDIKARKNEQVALQTGHEMTKQMDAFQIFKDANRPKVDGIIQVVRPMVKTIVKV